MADTGGILRFLQSMEGVQVAIILENGEVVDHFGIDDPTPIKEMMVFVNSMGTQIGQSLGIMPLVSNNVVFADRRFWVLAGPSLLVGVIGSHDVAIEVIAGQVQGMSTIPN